jgi:hypothetical protein
MNLPVPNDVCSALLKMQDRNGRRLQCGDRVVLKDGRCGQIHYWTERGGSVHLDDPVTLNGYDYTHVDVDLTTTVVKE